MTKRKGYIFKKFTGESDNYAPTTTIIHYDNEHANLDELLTEFENFLRGCGFCFDGTITIERTDEE